MRGRSGPWSLAETGRVMRQKATRSRRESGVQGTLRRNGAWMGGGAWERMMG